MSKTEFLTFLDAHINTHRRSEKYIKTHFPDIYTEIVSFTKFPENFKFAQKLYHYLNNDCELRLGICCECGKRCGFINSITGYRIYCSNRCASISTKIKEKKRQTCLERYGKESFSQTSEYKEKYKHACLDRYGVEYPLQDKKIREKQKQTCLGRYGGENHTNRDKARQTCLEKYGVENPSQTDEYREKYKRTCLERYGVENPFQLEEFKEKQKQTCLEKYGTKHAFQNKEVQEKQKQTCLERYGVENYSQADDYIEKFRETCLDRYGAEYPLQNKEIQEKQKQTCLERYGVDHYTQTDEYKEKAYQTKKANNSFNSSKIEEQLKEYFDLNNINYIYQYRSELYPFNCDFYFPDKDLYVEIQGSWTHGGHPFTGSEEDMSNLKRWRSKNTTYYDNAIEVWTIGDVKKREVAKRNNLNHLEIFSCDFDTCVSELSKLLIPNI